MFERFSFRNFDPPVDLESYAYSKLNWISEITPSDSSITADLERFGMGYRLKLQVASTAKTFSFEALANDAKVAIDRLEKRIGTALYEWHRKENTEMMAQL